jgi:hypothetical protein
MFSELTSTYGSLELVLTVCSPSHFHCTAVSSNVRIVIDEEDGFISGAFALTIRKLSGNVLSKHRRRVDERAVWKREILDTQIISLSSR